jgi:hypothetical protein
MILLPLIFTEGFTLTLIDRSASASYSRFPTICCSGGAACSPSATRCSGLGAFYRALNLIGKEQLLHFE